MNQFDVLYRSGYFSKDKELNKSYVPGSDCSARVSKRCFEIVEISLVEIQSINSKTVDRDNRSKGTSCDGISAQ